MIDDLLFRYALLYLYCLVGWCPTRTKRVYVYSIALGWAALRILYVSRLLIVY
jgi:hypothetical protein